MVVAVIADSDVSPRNFAREDVLACAVKIIIPRQARADQLGGNDEQAVVQRHNAVIITRIGEPAK